MDGVGEVEVFGSAFVMRIWLDPEKLHEYSLTPADIKTAITTQNVRFLPVRSAVCPLPKVRL